MISLLFSAEVLTIHKLYVGLLPYNFGGLFESTSLAAAAALRALNAASACTFLLRSVAEIAEEVGPTSTLEVGAFGGPESFERGVFGGLGMRVGCIVLAAWPGGGGDVRETGR